MHSTRTGLFKFSRPLFGGSGDNPYYMWARWGTISSYGSSYEMERDIRHPADGHWGPTRYGGNAIPSMGEWLIDWNPGHPVIEPMYHPKLTHKQKITRLYRKCLQTTDGCMGATRPMQVRPVMFGHTFRQIRQEFEKNRYVDEGSAEWLFVRCNEYLEFKKPKEPNGHYGWPGKMYHSRFTCDAPDAYWIFPHGFDPDEANRLKNPWHRFGIPDRGAGEYHNVLPINYMMTLHDAHSKSYWAAYGAVAMFFTAMMNFWVISEFKLGHWSKMPGDWAWDVRDALDMHVGLKSVELDGVDGQKRSSRQPMFPTEDFLAPRRGGPHMAPG